MKAAASGSAGKSFTSPWRMANFRPGNSRSVVLVIFIMHEYSTRSTRQSGGHRGESQAPAPQGALGLGRMLKGKTLCGQESQCLHHTPRATPPHAGKPGAHPEWHAGLW